MPSIITLALVFPNFSAHSLSMFNSFFEILIPNFSVLGSFVGLPIFFVFLVSFVNYPLPFSCSSVRLYSKRGEQVPHLTIWIGSFDYLIKASIFCIAFSLLSLSSIICIIIFSVIRNCSFVIPSCTFFSFLLLD